MVTLLVGAAMLTQVSITHAAVPTGERYGSTATLTDTATRHVPAEFRTLADSFAELAVDNLAAQVGQVNDTFATCIFEHGHEHVDWGTFVGLTCTAPDGEVYFAGMTWPQGVAVLNTGP
jgi:hypothetical protein